VLYRSVVEHKLRNAFAALNRGDYAPILGSFGEPIEHAFAGDHALGGTRRTMAGVRAWYVRLQAIFPDLYFEIDSIAVNGMPWNTLACVEWRDRFTLRDGSARGNQGVHVLRLRWGKVVSLRIHTDTQKLTVILRELEAQGVVEAGLAPIADIA